MLPIKVNSILVGKHRYIPHSLFLTLMFVGILACIQASKSRDVYRAQILREFIDSLKQEGYKLQKHAKTAKIEEVPILEHEISKNEYENLYSTWVHYLKYREGYKSAMYLCPAGYRTVGYGHNIDAHGTTDGNSISYNRASELLHQDLQQQYEEVKRLLPNLKRAQHLAITSLAANCGLYKIMYVKGKKKKGYSTFWKECLKNGKPNFKVYCKYRTPKGKVCISTNLVNARAFEEMLYYSKKTAKFQFGKVKSEMTYAQVGEFFRQNVIKRDIRKS